VNCVLNKRPVFTDLVLNDSIGNLMLGKKLSGDWTFSLRCWENLCSFVCQLPIWPM